MTGFPKPKDIEREPETVHVFPDGREVLNLLTAAGRAEYQLRKYQAWTEQGRTCWICGQPLGWREASVDHKQPRGMGGARRDDRQENIGAVHYWCNSEKGSRRI